MISMTARAIEKLKEISEEEGIGHYSVRIKTLGGGCAGFKNDMYFEDQVSEVDEIFEFSEIKIIIDPLSFQYMEDVEIDWSDHPISSGFVFNNPRALNSCGCGKSFSY